MRLRDRANIESALQQTDWKIYGTGGAAELLGINPTTLLSRIKKMGIEKLNWTSYKIELRAGMGKTNPNNLIEPQIYRESKKIQRM